MPAQTALFHTLNRIYPLSPECAQDLRALTTVLHVPKRTVLLRTGQVETDAYFMFSGLAHVYVEHGENQAIGEKIKDDESTTRFSQAGDLLMSPLSFLIQQPSIEAIKTLEDSVLVSFSYQAIERLYTKYLGFNVVGRMLTQHYYLLAENRAYMLRRHAAPEKWAWFKLHYPHLKGRVPLKYIATFLGISREHLQRIADPDWRWKKQPDSGCALVV
jgi:CRP/FNR family transcriptional regulator, anaerobic regulatory protein